MTSSSSSQSEHDKHAQEYEPHCKCTRTTVNDGAGPSMVRFDEEDESTWDHQPKRPIYGVDRSGHDRGIQTGVLVFCGQLGDRVSGHVGRRGSHTLPLSAWWQRSA
jgi:hypothetical protein